jgi:cytidyltransferase-like protein
MKRKAVIVSGYFNPVHKGHLELFKKANEIGDFLIVLVNSDHQRKLKGSKEFQDENERLQIIQSLKSVGYACISVDKDKTQVESLKMIHHKFEDVFDLIFANGGDQTNETIPESLVCNELGIILVDRLGDKIQSSSWLLKK